MEYRCGSSMWSSASGGFAEWTLEGCVEREGRVSFGAPAEPALATSRWVTPGFTPSAAIVSWNCDTPEQTGVEVQLQIRHGDGSHSAWFSMGRWSSREEVPRGSVAGQKAEGVSIETDTLVSEAPFRALRTRVIPYGESAAAGPTLRRVCLTWSDPKPRRWKAARARANDSADAPMVIAGVPECSQMAYPDGGNVWCSPVSLAMVMGYWRRQTACGTLVEQTRRGVYDPVYGGHGNWAFNVAYAGAHGFVAQVVRFPSLAAARGWIRAGVPLILSVSWDSEGRRTLRGAPVRSSNGHLTVLVGFDREGRAVMNEPASPDDASVRRTYDARELEACWMTASGGAAYVVYPPAHPVPAYYGG